MFPMPQNETITTLKTKAEPFFSVMYAHCSGQNVNINVFIIIGLVYTTLIWLISSFTSASLFYPSSSIIMWSKFKLMRINYRFPWISFSDNLSDACIVFQLLFFGRLSFPFFSSPPFLTTSPIFPWLPLLFSLPYQSVMLLSPSVWTPDRKHGQSERPPLPSLPLYATDQSAAHWNRHSRSPPGNASWLQPETVGNKTQISSQNVSSHDRDCLLSLAFSWLSCKMQEVKCLQKWNVAKISYWIMYRITLSKSRVLSLLIFKMLTKW